MIVGACAWTYGAAPLAETLERIAAAGCDGVELPGEPDQIRSADARALLARHRPPPVAATAPFAAGGRRGVAQLDPAVRRGAVVHGRRLLGLPAESRAPPREGLGRGHLDRDGCLGALRGVGYAGALVLEVGPPGPDPFRPITDERSAAILDGFLRDSVTRLRAALLRRWAPA